jgi:predicted transcriptional regulator
MLVPCEVAVKCILPSVRAMIAKELVNKYELKQAEAAKLLGLSQPAISLYKRKIRGKAINLENDPDITKSVEKLADSMVKGPISHKEFILTFCEICKTIRAKGLLCEMHKTFDPSINIEKCELCSATNSLRCN